MPPSNTHPDIAAVEEKYILRSDANLRISFWQGNELYKVVVISPDGKITEQNVSSHPSGNEAASLSVELLRDEKIVRVPLEGITPDETELYRIGSEDQIQVLVWKDPGLSATVAVRPDGQISLPLIQDIQAEGLTTQELRDTITNHLKEFIENPEVTVSVVGINSSKIFIVGKVNHPGIFPLRQKTSLFQALTMAGGLSEFAHPRDMFILRQYGNKEVRIPVRYKDLTKGGDGGKNLILQSGDTIVVP